MAKSKQINHEYYSMAETCRNHLFDLYETDDLQVEDVHLDYYSEKDDEN